jgi:hypothetical protein
MRRRHALAFVVTAACGAPSPSRPVSNLTPDTPTAAEVAVDPAGPLGVLALPWETGAVVPTADAPSLVAGTTHLAIPARGTTVELTAGPTATIKFGCDGGTDLEVVPLTGATVADTGPVWVLPQPVPPTWSPVSLGLAVETDTRDERVVRAGEVVLATRRLDATHMALRIAIGDLVVHEERAETYLMAGAEPIDLDMTQGHYPGIPTPEAVFAFGATGPYLVVLDRSGYESVAYATLFVSRNGRARSIDSLGLDAYRCAF